MVLVSRVLKLRCMRSGEVQTRRENNTQKYKKIMGNWLGRAGYEASSTGTGTSASTSGAGTGVCAKVCA